MVNVPGGLRTVHIKGTRTGLTASITRERVNEIPLQFSGILYSFPGRWRQPIHISVLLLRTVQCLALFYQLFIASGLQISLPMSFKAQDFSRSIRLSRKSFVLDCAIAEPPLWLGFGLRSCGPRL